MLESELARLREENAELKKRAEEGRGVEDKLKKAEKRADGLEEKVSRQDSKGSIRANGVDGGDDTGKSNGQAERAECGIR